MARTVKSHSRRDKPPNPPSLHLAELLIFGPIRALFACTSNASSSSARPRWASCERSSSTRSGWTRPAASCFGLGSLMDITTPSICGHARIGVARSTGFVLARCFMGWKGLFAPIRRVDYDDETGRFEEEVIWHDSTWRNSMSTTTARARHPCVGRWSGIPAGS